MDKKSRCSLHYFSFQIYFFINDWASLVTQMVKNQPAVQETWIRYLGWEDPLEDSMATDSSILGFPGVSDGKESARNAGNLGSIPGSGRSPGEGMATHSSILAWRIPIDRGTWQASPWGLRVRHD